MNQYGSGSVVALATKFRYISHPRGTVNERTGNHVRATVHHPYDYPGVTVETSTDYDRASPSAATN